MGGDRVSWSGGACGAEDEGVVVAALDQAHLPLSRRRVRPGASDHQRHRRVGIVDHSALRA
jgi:hypothetical protein